MSTVPPALQLNVRFTPEHWAGVKRSLTKHKIEKILKRDEGWLQIYLQSGDVFARRADEMEHVDKLHANLEVFVQLAEGKIVTGLFIPLVGWGFQLTNEDLADQVKKTAHRNHIRRVENLQENRPQYQSREEDLPDWLSARIANFRAISPESFELHGWGYELIVCELVVQMCDGVDGKVFAEFASGVGATQNQVGCAAAIFSALTEMGEDAAIKIPAAMMPITQRPDYNYA